MIGPTIEAVVEWIVEKAPVHSSATSAGTSGHANTPSVAPSSSVFSAAGFVDLLSGLGRSFVGTVEQDEDLTDTPAAAVPSQSNTPAADECSGVIIHCFFSEPQDLPAGTHSSVSKSLRGDGTGGFVNDQWLRRISSRCAEKGVAINLWGVASFDSDELGLSSWLPLARDTGGRLYRSVLGGKLHRGFTQPTTSCTVENETMIFYVAIPKDERYLLTEKLQRELRTQRATKCLLKIRASPVVAVGT